MAGGARSDHWRIAAPLRHWHRDGLLLWAVMLEGRHHIGGPRSSVLAYRSGLARCADRQWDALAAISRSSRLSGCTAGGHSSGLRRVLTRDPPFAAR